MYGSCRPESDGNSLQGEMRGHEMSPKLGMQQSPDSQFPATSANQRCFFAMVGCTAVVVLSSPSEQTPCNRKVTADLLPRQGTPHRRPVAHTHSHDYGCIDLCVRIPHTISSCPHPHRVASLLEARSSSSAALALASCLQQ